MDDRHSAMESSMDSATELFLLMEDKGALGQPKTPSSAVENDDRTISVQVLEFKTSLLEAVEELHIHRDAEARYEEQICKLVLEKQESEWQTESLKSNISRMSNENSESLAAVKKQFQAQIKTSEVEKGKSQLAAELKDKEIISLKEELKQLQLLRYSLEKKLGELEQKLQLQTQTKDSHLNQLGEVERRFAAISRQCAMVKQAHEKLEQNVEEAMRINKKLTSINEKQESAIKALNKDFERVNKELVTLKVSSVCKPGEERMQDILKEQQLQQLQQRLFVETELNKKLSMEAAKERADKQEVLRSLKQSQSLLQTQTEVLCRTEQELRTLHEEYQVLKTEHELNQERTKEKDDSFTRLRDEYQNAKLAWEKEILRLQLSMKADEEELIALKEAYYLLQEERKHLSISAVHKAKDNHNSELALKDQENSSTSSDEINLVKVSSLCKGLEESHISPHDNSEPACHPDKDVLEESQKAKNDGCFHNNDTETLSTLSQSIGSDNISRPEDVNPMTNHLSELCDETNMGVSESEPVCKAFDKRCPSNPTHSITDSRLTELSGLETRSVYGVDGDPLALKPKDRPLLKNLCTSEVTEPQTSDKHMDSLGYATSPSNKFKDHQTTIPEFLDRASQKESQTTLERLSDDKTENVHRQETMVFYDKRALIEELIATQPHTSTEIVHKESPTVHLDTHHPEPKEFSPSEMICKAPQSLKSEQVLLIDKTTILTLVEVFVENDDQKDDSISNLEPLKSQQTELEVSSEDSKTTNPDQNTFSLVSTVVKHQSDVDQKNISVVDTSNHPEDHRYQSSFPLDPLVDQTTLVTSVDTENVIFENGGQKDGVISDLQPLKAQQTELGVSSEDPKTIQPDRDPLSPESTIVKDQSDADQKDISEVDASNHLGIGNSQSSFPLNTTLVTSVKTMEAMGDEGISDLEPRFEEPKIANRDPSSPGSAMVKYQSDVDPKHISGVHTLNYLESSNSQSSFAWDTLVDRTTSLTSINTVEVGFENGQKVEPGPLKSQQTELRSSSNEPKTIQPGRDPSSDQNSEVDIINHPEARRYQSSFAWDTFMKGNKKPHQIPSRPELWPSGFHKHVSPFCAPLFTKDKLAKRAITKIPDRMDTASKCLLLQKSDSQGEWNAIKQSFSEILMEKENPVLIPYSLTRSSSPVSFSMGNGLRQDCTPTVPPTKLQSLEKQAWTETSSFEGKDERKQSDIMAQIAKIEEFMSNEGLIPQKRRKIE